MLQLLHTQDRLCRNSWNSRLETKVILRISHGFRLHTEQGAESSVESVAHATTQRREEAIEVASHGRISLPRGRATTMRHPRRERPLYIGIAFVDGRLTAFGAAVITPSHNPPDDGGFKYDPPYGGPADFDITSWIETRANGFLRASLGGVKRIPFTEAVRASTTHRHDYLHSYVADLENVVDMEAIRDSKLCPRLSPIWL